MTDLDGEIVALRVSGVSERDICIRLGCTMGRVRAALDENAARMFAPGCVARTRAELLETLAMLEQAWALRRRLATRGARRCCGKFDASGRA